MCVCARAMALEQTVSNVDNGIGNIVGEMALIVKKFRRTEKNNKKQI